LRANENGAKKLLISKNEGSQRRKFMKQVKKDLQAISKSLKQLALKTEQIAKGLPKPEKVKPARKPEDKAKAKVTKRPDTASPSGAVMAIIKRSRKGVDVPTLKNKTGLEGRKVNDIIYRMSGKLTNHHMLWLERTSGLTPPTLPHSWFVRRIPGF
jgi:hypothetical protein